MREIEASWQISNSDEVIGFGYHGLKMLCAACDTLGKRNRLRYSGLLNRKKIPFEYSFFMHKCARKGWKDLLNIVTSYFTISVKAEALFKS
ncbi:hypothetical protein GGE65_006720 [Skermanella aerolata]